MSPVFEEDVYQALELGTCVNGRQVYGGPSAKSVQEQIDRIKAFLAERQG